MTKHLILDAGLHGDGDVLYYVDQLMRIREWYTGWPKLIYKTQYWSGSSVYRTECITRHGREPLRPVPLRNHYVLWDICHAMGIDYGVTLHDRSIPAGQAVADWVKLSQFNSADPAMQEHILEHCSRQYDPPKLIITSPACSTEQPEWFRTHPGEKIELLGVSRYPHSEVIPGWATGFSCHWDPSRYGAWAVQMKDLNDVEVHITTRSVSARLLPGDMPVCLNMERLRHFVEALGAYWA